MSKPLKVGDPRLMPKFKWENYTTTIGLVDKFIDGCWIGLANGVAFAIVTCVKTLILVTLVDRYKIPTFCKYCSSVEIAQLYAETMFFLIQEK